MGKRFPLVAPERSTTLINTIRDTFDKCVVAIPGTTPRLPLLSELDRPSIPYVAGGRIIFVEPILPGQPFQTLLRCIFVNPAIACVNTELVLAVSIAFIDQRRIWNRVSHPAVCEDSSCIAVDLVNTVCD